MRTGVVLLVCLIVTGCGVTSSTSNTGWSDWESKETMLPVGFPFPVKDEMRTVGRQQFWIIDYDTNGDENADMRVWYFVKSTEHIKELDKFRMLIARNPHKVERLKLGALPVFSKIDHELTGEAQEIQKHVDGHVVSTYLK